MNASPTKAWLVSQYGKSKWQWHYDYAFGKRPGEQLFDLGNDPDQTVNVAADPKSAKTCADMEQRLMGDDFYVGDKDPRIAVSVDMLDTGIDVPECVNLVFFKRVQSKTKFWQMIGRGRAVPRPVRAGPGQGVFLRFDCCENLEFFGENPEGYEGRAPEPVKQRIFRGRLNLVDRIGRLPERDAALNALWSDLLDIVAIRMLATTLHWDGEKARFTNSEEANRLVAPPPL